MVKKGQKRMKMKAMKEKVAGVCLQHVHRVQPTSQHAILLFLNILVDSRKHQNGRVDVNPLLHFQSQRKRMLLKMH